VLYTNLTGPVGELTRENQIFMYLPGIALIIAFPGSQVLFKNHLKNNLDASKELQSKLAVFQTGHLLRLSVIEAATLLSGVASFVIGNNINLSVMAIGLLIMTFLAPTPFKIGESLNLSPNERQQLNQ